MSKESDMEASDLIRIMQFGDSALPIGAFTFSNGVESAIQKVLSTTKKR